VSRFGCASIFAFLVLASVTQKSAHSASFDCGKAATRVETAICADADLSRADEEMSSLFKSIVTGSDNNTLAVAGQRAWLRYRDLSCGEIRHEEIAGCLKLNYYLRREFLSPSGNATASGVPITWWGSDITPILDTRFFKDGKMYYTVMSVGAGIGGRVVAEIAVDHPGSMKRSPGDYLLLDLFSGAIIGSRLDEPALANQIVASTDEWRLHGLEMEGAFSLELKLDDQVTVRAAVEHCEAPFDASLEVSEKSAYLVAPRKTPRKIVQSPMSEHCATDGSEDEVWTVDFDNLAQYPIHRLPDGSFIALGVATHNLPRNLSYLIRYRPDLTSDFFNGREDLTVLDEDAAVDIPSDRNSPQEAKNAVRVSISTAIAAQLAHSNDAFSITHPH